MKKRKKTYDFIDDGRVIASMNVDGMPRAIIRRTSFDEFGKPKEKKEPVRITKQERRSVLLGAVTSHIIFAICIFGSFALFILFCIKIWFK